MMYNEFFERTNVKVDDKEYSYIEQSYYESELNKDDFCEQWKKDYEDGHWQTEYKLRRHLDEEKENADKAIEALKRTAEQIAEERDELQKELDKELEWKDCEDAGTNMEQSRYQELKRIGVVLTDNDAKDLIYKNFGFDPTKVELVHMVSTYEVNRHHSMRVKQTFQRQAVYDASDWNYIRFDCAGWSYEMINGELRQYES